jgi:hypothetical protein
MAPFFEPQHAEFPFSRQPRPRVWAAGAGERDPSHSAALGLAEKLLSAQPDISIEEILAVACEYADLLAQADASRLANARKKRPTHTSHH